MDGKVYIGTSGWVYKHWKDVVYPGKMPASKWLSYYSTLFPVTEINNCFYRLPTEETVVKWMQEVPADFLFCPKMSRFLTHMKKLRDPGEPLERFFSVFHIMQKQMGPVLIQLPNMVKFNYDVAENFYRILKLEYSQYKFVMEVRHPSWFEEDSLTLMAKYDIGFVISHSGGFFPYKEIVTAETIYIRFHGPAELYASSYPDEMLWEYAKKVRKWKKEGHNIWVFFNNDIHGYAVPDAQKLRAMVDKEKSNKKGLQ